jgi:hypothetical protein
MEFWGDGEIPLTVLVCLTFNLFRRLDMTPKYRGTWVEEQENSEQSKKVKEGHQVREEHQTFPCVQISFIRRIRRGGKH